MKCPRCSTKMFDWNHYGGGAFGSFKSCWCCGNLIPQGKHKSLITGGKR